MDVLIYNKDRIGKGVMEDLNKPNIFVWVDIFKPAIEDLKKIAKITDIPIEDLKLSLSADQRPRVVDIIGSYSLIIFAAPAFGEEILTGPLFIFVSKVKNNVITIRNHDTKSISRIKENIQENKGMFQRGSSYFVYRLLDQILTTYFSVVDHIEEQIDKLEDEALQNPDKQIVSKLFKIKKTLIYFHKSLTANREVIVAIEKEYVHDIDRKTLRQFRALYNDVVQLIDMAATYRDILAGTLDVYLSAVSNNLNQIMKVLTVISAFIMIPNLIASIYGMNFHASIYNMPELSWKYGYFFALGLMIIAVLITYILFRKKGWIHRRELI